MIAIENEKYMTYLKGKKTDTIFMLRHNVSNDVSIIQDDYYKCNIKPLL